MNRLVGMLSLSLVGVGLGCGEVAKVTPDAAIDSPPAPPEPVKVRALTFASDGAIDPQAIAIFRDATGAVVQQGKVDAKGEAEALVGPGGTVQMLHFGAESADSKSVLVVNFHDVQPGDLLQSGLPERLPRPGGEAATMTASFTALLNFGHQFWTECGATSSAGPTVALSLPERCHRNTIDVLGIATSTATPPEVPRYVLTNTAFVSGGAFTIPNAWTPMANFTATLSNVPAEISAFNLSRATLLHDGPTPLLAAQSVNVGDPPAGSAAASVPYPAGVGVRAQVTATLTMTGSRYSHRIDIITPNVAATEAIDAGELMIPWITGVTVNAADRSLAWTQTGTGTPDVQVAAAQFSYTRDPIRYSVTVYDLAPPSPDLKMTFPALPPEYAEFDPAQQTTAVTIGTGILGYVDQDNFAGYGEAHGRGISLVSTLGSNVEFAGQAIRRRSTLATTLRGVNVTNVAVPGLPMFDAQR